MEGISLGLGDYVFWTILQVIPAWKIFGRAGLSPFWSLLVFIPVLGALIALVVLAMSTWPKERRTE